MKGKGKRKGEKVTRKGTKGKERKEEKKNLEK